MIYEKNTSSPQTSKEDEPAPVLDWASGRIRQENSEVRALRMVFLRNALHSFITGDGTRTRSGPRSGKTNARPNEIARRTKTSKIQKNPNRPNPTSARASVETQLFSITEYSEGIRICACLHPRAVGSVGSGRARRARITHRSRAARRGAVAFAACAKRRGGGGETAARAPRTSSISPLAKIRSGRALSKTRRSSSTLQSVCNNGGCIVGGWLLGEIR